MYILGNNRTMLQHVGLGCKSEGLDPRLAVLPTEVLRQGTSLKSGLLKFKGLPWMCSRRWGNKKDATT